MIATDKDEIYLNERGHYMINGREYYRNSLFLSHKEKPYLKEWRKRIGDEEADRIVAEACTYGTRTHAMAEAIDKHKTRVADRISKLDTRLPLLRPKYDEWQQKNIQSWEAVEQMVYSEKYRLAGRADRVGVSAHFPGLNIFDIKTSKQISPDTIVQLTVYWLCWNEENDINPIPEGERLLDAMDDIYSYLVTVDFPDAITGNVRRVTDMVRGVTERTRGDMTTSIQQRELRKALRDVEKKLDQK